MKIIHAETMGVCFGVRNALQTALHLPHPETITIHGELVHNEEVRRALTARGFDETPEAVRERNVPSTPRVLLTAHGVSDRERARLVEAGKELIDTTCPLVRRAHEAALRLQAEGYFVVVVGRRGHVEVRGFVGDLERYVVVESETEVRAFGVDRIGVICQTTTEPSVAQAVVERIRMRNPKSEVRYVATICQPTLDRQRANELLLDRVGALVVVGGRNSNNTRALVRRAIERGVPCVHVQRPEQLDPCWLAPFETVGLTAGTSTPDEQIEAVLERLEAIAECLSVVAGGVK